MLYGDLGTILNWIDRQPVGKTKKTNTPGESLTGVSVSVVAGERNQLNLRGAIDSPSVALCAQLLMPG
jgi:site-specific DNA recombinase